MKKTYKTYALLDCNNFFVSCERVFRPELKKKAVMVLSSNDGCVVVRSQEVKDLGIPMGIPYFKIKDIVKQNKITVFSSNFSLYRDISNRVMNLVLEEFPSAEVYSIDEVFIDLSRSPDIQKSCINLRKKILKYCGVPVSVGVSRTKTLAKIANSIAKKSVSGFFDMIATETIDEICKSKSIGEVWGIGQSSNQKLLRLGVKTIDDFRFKSNSWIKKELGINGLRKAEELRGVPAILVCGEEETRKSMVSSRSFAKDIGDIDILKQAISNHVGEIARQLRDENLSTKRLSVFLRTNRHRQLEQKNVSASFVLASATSDLILLNNLAMKLTHKIYSPGIVYKKSGVAAGDFEPSDLAPLCDIFGNPLRQNDKLMRALDYLNDKYGHNTVMLARQFDFGVDRKWKTNCAMRSPAYTTNKNEIAKVF